MSEQSESEAPDLPEAPDLIEHLGTAVERAGLAHELRSWAGLGIGALAVAGVFALLLAISRIPGVENVFPWPLGFFEKGLVIHVVFSFVVWFLAVYGVLASSATAVAANGPPRFAILGNVAVWLGVSGFVLMAVPALLDRGEASLNNYIPVIIDPLYYAGLLMFGAGLALVAIRFLLNVRNNRAELKIFVDIGMICTLILIGAFGAFAMAYIPMHGETPDVRFNEDLFWGGGHALQFLNTAMMLSGWVLLAWILLRTPMMMRGRFITNMGMLVIPPLGMPFLYGSAGIAEGDLIEAFTQMQYLLAPPVAMMAIVMLPVFITFLRRRELPWKDIAFVSLMLSLLTFAIGGTLGLFVDGTDTRTPAHYHAVIAAVNITFMGLFFRLVLPAIGRPVPLGRKANVVIWLYAVGQMVASVGLFMAGGYGAPRKTAGQAQGLEDFGAIAGLYMNGVGAAIAVIGGIMFIWICAKALLRR